MPLANVHALRWTNDTASPFYFRNLVPVRLPVSTILA